MRPWETIEAVKESDGVELVLARRGAEWVVRANGRTLMSSAAHASEEQLAHLALERVPAARTVLLGGLGLGYTARAALDRLGPEARLIVVELSRALVGWNRTHLAELAARPLEDPRVRLQLADAVERIAEATGAFDAILLDLDNGPTALARAANQRLYGVRGVKACRDALKAGGVLAVWSAGPDEAYLERLRRSGFTAVARTVTARATGGVRHTVFLATKDTAPRRGRARS